MTDTTTHCEKCKATRRVATGYPNGVDAGKLYTLKGKSFISPYTNGRAMELLDKAIEDGTIYGDFAKDLRQKHMTRRRGLSPKQWAWVHCIIHDRIDHADADAMPSGEPRETIVEDMSKIRDAFEAARTHKKNPKIRFEFEDGRQLVLAVAHPRARKAGSIKVTDGGRYGESKWYGRINTDGTWEPARRRHADADEVLDFLKKFAKDPAAVAIEYGKASGRCCFCGRELKHGQLGYGPECAKKWGMPWTEKMAKDGTVVPEAIAATVATPVALGGTPGTKKPTPTKPEPATVPEHGTTRPTYLNFKVRVYEARSGGVPGTPLTGTDYTKDEAVFAKMWDRRVAKYPDAVILAFARTDEGWVPYCSHEPAEAPAPAPAPATPTLCVLLKHCPEHWSPAADTTIPEKWEARVMLDGTMPMGLTEDELVAFGATDDEALITLGTILNRWGIKADVEVTRI